MEDRFSGGHSHKVEDLIDRGGSGKFTYSARVKTTYSATIWLAILRILPKPLVLPRFSLLSFGRIRHPGLAFIFTIHEFSIKSDCTIFFVF